MDEASANWPADADSECCFIVTDPDEKKTLYLIAEDSKTAQYVQNNYDDIILMYIGNGLGNCDST